MEKFLKSVYGALPFKKQVFSFVKIFWSPPEKIFRHLYFKGKFRVRIDRSHSFLLSHYGFMIENEIFWRGLEGGWEKVSFSLWMQLCRRSGHILDLGANTGIYSLIAKTVNPSANVYAFDPVERVFEKLEENNRLNRYDIRCVKKAVSDYTGKATIYDRPTEHVLSVTVNRNTISTDPSAIPVEIETIKLADFFREEKITQIDLMKIDVETHEPEVLKGMEQYLQQFRPAMLIEVLSDEIGKRIEAMVAPLHFLYFNIDEKKGVRQTEHIVKSDHYNYLLCSAETARELRLVS